LFHFQRFFQMRLAVTGLISRAPLIYASSLRPRSC
jgi:hypothetical protein